MTGDRGWAGHWAPATRAGCPGSAPTGSQGWRRGCPVQGAAHPLLSARVHVWIFPGKNQDGPETDLTLEQCFMSLCSSVYFPWAKANGEYLVEIAKKH